MRLQARLDRLRREAASLTDQVPPPPSVHSPEGPSMPPSSTTADQLRARITDPEVMRAARDHYAAEVHSPPRTASYDPQLLSPPLRHERSLSPADADRVARMQVRLARAVQPQHAHPTPQLSPPYATHPNSFGLLPPSLPQLSPPEPCPTCGHESHSMPDGQPPPKESLLRRQAECDVEPPSSDGSPDSDMWYYGRASLRSCLESAPVPAAPVETLEAPRAEPNRRVSLREKVEAAARERDAKYALEELAEVEVQVEQRAVDREVAPGSQELGRERLVDSFQSTAADLVFEQMDINNDGVIDKDEWRRHHAHVQLGHERQRV